MIGLSDVTVRFGAQLLYTGVSWQLRTGGHYGLVGANGSGKSTLLRVLAGELTPEEGQVSRPGALRIGTLIQDHFDYDDARALDVVLMGRPALGSALAERERLLAEQNETAETGERLAELEVTIGDLDGYALESHAAGLLAGLGIEHRRHARPMRELSSGLRLRVLLAQTLFADPELLLLDEPTNHLDIPSIAWLEGYLRAFRGTFVVVSHDRHFLNAIADTIADLDYGELRLYPGRYDAFEDGKALAVRQKEAEIARTEARVQELQRFVERFRAKATKARQASARKKQIERIVLPEVTRSSRRAPSFRFHSKRRPGRDVLRVRELARGYGGAPVFRGVSLSVRRGERVAVVGPNGVGKSTLLKTVAGVLAPDAGSVEFGHAVSAGYFAQNHRELLGGEQSVLAWLSGADPESAPDVATVRGALGAVLLGGDEAEKRCSHLSGGEAARLLLAGLMVRRPNLMIVDEPTNHLDLEARDALMRALRAYDGTVLFVSHDRHFVSSVGTRVLAIAPGGIVEDFAGTYEEYLERLGADYLAGEGSLPRRSTARRARATEAPTRTRERERASAVSRLTRAVEGHELAVADLERKIRELETRFISRDYYASTPRDQVDDDTRRQRTLRGQLDALMVEWERASADLEALGSPP